MPKTTQTPTDALNSMMDEYQLTAFSLSKVIGISNSAMLQIIKGKSKITVSTALRLSKVFGQDSAFWLNLQREADLAEAAKDEELSSILKGITKVQKPAAKPKADAKAAKKTPAAKRKAPAKAGVAKAAKPAKKAKAKPKK